MDSKWIDRAYQFESEPSGGGDAGADEPKGDEPKGGEPAGDAPAGDDTPPVSDVDSGDVSHPLETREDYEPIDDVDGEPGEPGEPAGPTGDSPAVAMPADLGAMFRPTAPVSDPAAATPAAAPVSESRPTATETAPVTGPPRADFPTEEDWLADAGAAATKQAAAIAYSNWLSTEPLRRDIETMKGRFQGEDKAVFEEKVYQVGVAIDETEAAVANFYAENGPLNSDAEFRNNPKLQGAVKEVIGKCVERGLWIADTHGEVGPLNRIARDPYFAISCLALAKPRVLSPDPGFKPGATPVTQQPAVKPTGDGLTADQRKALKAAKADGSSVTAAAIRAATKKTQESIW